MSKQRLAKLVLASLSLVFLVQANAAPVVSDELRILSLDGTLLNPTNKLFEQPNGEGPPNTLIASVPLPTALFPDGATRVIELTDAQGVSDWLQVVSLVDINGLNTLQFFLISDEETPLTHDPNTNVSIPEAGDANHPLNGEGFLDVTNDVFSGALANPIGAASPLFVLVKSDTDATVAEPESSLLLISCFAALWLLRRRKH
jgi:hypothetical protein